MSEANLMDKVVALAKRRGFIFPSSEIYGGLANTYDYGPLGVELKNNIKNLWWNRFVHRRDDIVGIDAALIMNPKVWEASGHVERFRDLLSECRNCNNRIRLDEYLTPEEGKWFNIEQDKITTKFGYGIEAEAKVKPPFQKLGDILNSRLNCPICGKRNWTEAQPFSLLFATQFGATRGEARIVYLRPETAQAMFVDFKNILDTTRGTLPFGVAQVGKAFRNEITPGNFIFRTREFEMMEIEYFVKPEDWQKHFEEWRDEVRNWMKEVGINLQKVHEVEISNEERAHYSERTIDFEYEYPFGQKELYGLAYRTDFDLKAHFKEPPYRDLNTGKEFWPHVIEPTWGVDRTTLVVLLDAYTEEADRVVLKLKPKLAPYKAAVFPLLANKPELISLARKIYDDLRQHLPTAWDDRGNIGKRYYSQDEIGTPYCVTVDFDSLEDKAVTVRDRDSMKQERVKIEELVDYLQKKQKKLD